MAKTAALATGLVQAVQTARRKADIDDETYRGILHAEFGVSSTKQLTPSQAGQLLDRFNGKTSQRGKASGWTKAAPRADQRLLFVLWKQAVEIGAAHTPGKAGLRAFLDARFGRSDPGLMEPAMTRKAAEAIKAMIARKQCRVIDG